MKIWKKVNLSRDSGADLGFSRGTGGGGGADFQKSFENFVDIFLRSIKFSELSQIIRRIYFV